MRVARAGRELADALMPAAREGRPQGRLASQLAGPADPFVDPTPFEELLRG
jgi:hypothetical protein